MLAVTVFAAVVVAVTVLRTQSVEVVWLAGFDFCGEHFAALAADRFDGAVARIPRAARARVLFQALKFSYGNTFKRSPKDVRL